MSPAFPASRLLCSILGLALLAACGGPEQDQAKPESDPALTGALEDEIMTDAELSGEACRERQSVFGGYDCQSTRLHESIQHGVLRQTNNDLAFAAVSV